MKAALYARVSTSSKSIYGGQRDYDQRPEVQLEPLRQAAQARGWTVVREFVDRTSTRRRRPEIEQLMFAARRHELDIVMVWRFDRFARSTRELLESLDEFQHLGIDFLSLQEAIDTSSPLGRAMLSIVGAIAQFEREIIRERVLAGMEHARQFGTRSGKEIGRPRAIFNRDHVRVLREQGMTWQRIADELSIGRGTARRAFQQANANPA